MSTTFWLPSDTTAAVSPTPSAVDWNGHVNTVSRVLNLVRGLSAVTTLAYNPDAGDDLVDANSMVAQFVSPILPPQTIAAQRVLYSVKLFEANAANNLFSTWKLYAVNTAGTSVLATLVGINRGIVEAGTSIAGRIIEVTSTEAVLAVNFRLVLEVGLGGLPVAGGNHNGSISFGEDGASGVVHNLAGAVATSPTLQFNTGIMLNALPAVGDVEDGVSFGDPNSPSTGTLVLPTEAQVENGVGFGADGTEFEGTLVAGGGTVILIRR